MILLKISFFEVGKKIEICDVRIPVASMERDGIDEPSTDIVLQVAEFYIKDVTRQSVYVENQPTLPNALDTSKAIYEFTRRDKQLTETICKFLTQGTVSDITMAIYDRFMVDGMMVAQVRGDEGRLTFNIYRENGNIKILGTCYFHQYKLSEAEVADSLKTLVKGTTLLSLSTGNAIMNYDVVTAEELIE